MLTVLGCPAPIKAHIACCRRTMDQTMPSMCDRDAARAAEDAEDALPPPPHTEVEQGTLHWLGENRTTTSETTAVAWYLPPHYSFSRPSHEHAPRHV
jgi:hypothetical protein